MSSRNKWIVGTVVAVITGLVLIQLIPAGGLTDSLKRENPAITSPVEWTSPEAESLARTACYDCHSNETQWRWYSKIAPVSWVVARDVNAGREELNFSEYNTSEVELEEIAESVRDEMPPFQYTFLHPSAKLTDAEKQTLIDGIFQLPASVSAENDGGENADADEDDD
ncbi:MAG TPA: heme-binding domain-containing protein [Aggregatilineales bacterium]|nr:heme-binding domain-containing protein [Aggregatilineales bacterium]